MEAADTKRPFRRWLLMLPLALVAVGLTLVIGIWLLTRGGGESPVARQAAPPLAPQPSAPPPIWKGELAEPAAGAKSDVAPTSLDAMLQQLPTAVSRIGAQLEKAPIERAAASNLLVLPGDVRSAEPISRFPRHERWEIQFPPGNTIDSYARQLDFFKMELGVIGEADKVTYLSSVAAPTPAVRSAAAADDKRLYLIWQRGAMREAAQELATRAKIDAAGKVLAHFCSSEVEAQLAQIEDDFARQKGIRRIRKTIFGIKPNDSGGYSCYVIDQKSDDS